MTKYPTIRNCNYESAENDYDRAIDTIRGEVEGGIDNRTETADALDRLEQMLVEELDDNGEYAHACESQRRIEECEAAVRDAYGSGPEGDCELYGEDNETLTADELGLTESEYVTACRESLTCGQAEGWILVGELRVYAR